VDAVRRLEGLGRCCAAGLVLLALLALTGSARAATVSGERPLLFVFDGSDSTAGRFEAGLGAPNSIAVDSANGDVYVGSDEFSGDEHAGYVSRFDAEGNPLVFPATGTSSLFSSAEGPLGNLLGVAVDNSSGVNQHRFYITQFGNSLLHAFDPSGEGLWSLSPTEGQLEDVSVDAAGHPWTIGAASPATQYENVSGRPQPTGCTIPGEGSAIDADQQGDIYLSSFGTVLKYTDTGNCTFTESTLDPNASDVSVDQSSPTGRVFTAQTGDFEEYDSNGTLLGSFGSEYLSAEGVRLAYSPSRDWVYVTQRVEPHPVVVVFGPPGSGTVPDVTGIATPAAVGISDAHFEGTVNPHGVAATAHFEWKRPEESWAAAETSPPQTLTADETPQTVAFDAQSLRGNTTYEVRLVTVNSGADKLHSFSAEAKEFSTSEAPSAPDVSIATPTLVTLSSATIEGTVNPKGDTADWRVQLSTDPACSEGFIEERLRHLEQGSNVPVGVSYELEGLLPSQHYCVRIAATNSFGTEVSSVEEFETDAVAPSEVELLPAAPREATSALLNARVDPRGDVLSYRFEYSEDGGATWIQLPVLEEMGEAREKIVIGEVVSGLQPATTYRFRLGSVESGAGPAVTPAGEMAFTTRSAEADDSGCANASVRTLQQSGYLRHCRAFELVNNPDKGAQDVILGETSAEGDHAFWRIPGGAPGSPSGTSSTFLAERTPSGWLSRSIAPPASEQIGGGTWNYLVEATSSDFSTVIAAPSNRNSEESALVRLRPGTGQELLRSYPNEERRIPFNGGDVTDDAAHVLFINGELSPSQIEEVGAGEPAEVVSIMPDGTPSECGMSTGNEGDNFTGVSGSGHGAGRDWRPGYHRMSTVDASRFYFQVQPNGECGSSSLALYQRNRSSGVTTLIDPGSAAGEPHVIRATPDGRAVYFGTPSPLDPADENQHEDVYRWEEGEGAVCLTCEATADAHLESDSPIMVSDDFSHVYFGSTSKLSPAATAGARNIYVLEQGEIGFVATLPAGSGGDSGLRAGGAKLSADGRILLFPSASGRTLTADEAAGEVELYRYDDGDGSLECASCRHGASTADPAQGEFEMSADGSTIAFVTAAPLVGADVNSDSDVYEWRDGKVALITGGLLEGARPRVAGVSRDGSDVFFSIVNPGLTGFERDGLRNAYDARVSGGFQPPSPPAHCSEDLCQGPLLPALPAPAPASSSFHGKGNVTPSHKRRCRRGKARRHRHCGGHHRHRHGRHSHGKEGGAK
jgi:hypothetical protein